KVKKVSKKRISTRQLILDTAGELFADYGMKGTSIKMIADASKQNIAAANYHFGSKKNLYIDTIKHVVEKLSENSDLSKEKVSAKNFDVELEKYVKSRAKILLSGSNPPWYGCLIVRALQEAPKNVQEMALEFFKPEVEFLEEMAKAVKGKIKPLAAKMWAYTVISQVIFYVFARKMILLAVGKKSYTPDFIEEVVQHIVVSCKVALKA
ncbi:MAG: TetR/AcrR family transcriptional regulator, partial [Candidatus Riflebacteria bacterium]